jgi:hypothetical protein
VVYSRARVCHVDQVCALAGFVIDSDLPLTYE